MAKNDFVGMTLKQMLDMQGKLAVAIEEKRKEDREETKRAVEEFAEKRGFSHAYCGHHWAHWGCRFGRVRYFRASLVLAAWRLGNATKIRDEGCDELELDLVFKRAMVVGHLAEHRKPRKYARHGLVKIPP